MSRAKQTKSKKTKNEVKKMRKPTKVKKQKPTKSSKSKGAEKPKEEKQKRSHRFKPGTRALMDIRKEQHPKHGGVKPAMRRGPFRKWMKEEIANLGFDNVMLNPDAVAMVQAFVEAKLIDIISNSYAMTVRVGKRVKLSNTELNIAAGMTLDSHVLKKENWITAFDPPFKAK